MLHVVPLVKRKMVRVEVWFLAASVHSLVAKRKEKSVEEEAERRGRVWWQQEEEETQTGHKGGWCEGRRYREATPSSSHLNFVTRFVNIEQSHFEGYTFVILYSFMKIFIYVHFWNGFRQLELVMNRGTSLSGAKGGERRSRDPSQNHPFFAQGANGQGYNWVYL